MKIHRNFEDPHHLSSKAKKKKGELEDQEEQEEQNKDKKKEKDVILGLKHKNEMTVQKQNINGHEWLTFTDKD